jgi:hypothetical protein
VRAEHGQRGHQGQRADRRDKFQPEFHAPQIGTRTVHFQLSFRKTPATAVGRRDFSRVGYFTGTWSMCGQTAATRASSSGPPSFFGVSARQPCETENGAVDGLKEPSMITFFLAQSMA